MQPPPRKNRGRQLIDPLAQAVEIGHDAALFLKPTGIVFLPVSFSHVSSKISIHLPPNSVPFAIWGKAGEGGHKTPVNALSSTD